MEQMSVTKALENSYGNMDDAIEHAYEKAEKLGLDVVVPGPDELFIDIDSAADLHVYGEMVDVLKKNGIEIISTTDTPSVSGDWEHRHLVIKLGRELSDLGRVALQACMGSDRKRELLAILRIWNGNTPVTLFFEKPYVGGGNG